MLPLACTGRKLGYWCWPGYSCGLPVLVDQPSEPGPALDPSSRDGGRDEVGGVVRCAQAHALALVAAAGVVVADVVAENHAQVPIAGDELRSVHSARTGCGHAARSPGRGPGPTIPVRSASYRCQAMRKGNSGGSGRLHGSLQADSENQNGRGEPRQGPRRDRSGGGCDCCELRCRRPGGCPAASATGHSSPRREQRHNSRRRRIRCGRRPAGVLCR
jgi:hypothetical protein